MSHSPRIGYVVKRYPRFSETFIVNEVLAHEAAGTDIEIFSIRPCTDTHFQNAISQVRAPLTRISSSSPKWSALWPQLRAAGERFPGLWDVLRDEQHAMATTVAQGIELAGYVRDRHITHLHAHFATLPAAVARLAALIAEVPYSLTAHAKDIFHESVEDAVLQQRLEDAAAIITVSQFNVEHLSSRFPQLGNRLHCVYNGLKLDALPFQEPATPARLILGVGRLVEKKGFDVLVYACAVLRERGVSFACEIVGGGDQQAALQKQLDQLQLHDHVTLTGPLPQAVVKQRLHEAAVMAAPCVIGEDGNRDGLPTVLLEAMALGTPCVATDVTGIPEVIRQNQTGLIVPQHDPVALADALTRMLDDAVLRTRCARSARALIDEQFDSRHTSEQIRDLLQAAAWKAPVLQEAS